MCSLYYFIMYHLSAWDSEAEYFGSQLHLPSLITARASAQQWLSDLPDDAIVQIISGGDIGGDIIEELTGTAVSLEAAE